MTDDPDPGNALLWQLLLLLALIFCNAYFAASEIALLSVNENKLKKMAEEGHKKAKQILKLTENSSNFLATIQIGVTLAGFLTSATAAQSLATPLATWFVSVVPSLASQIGVVQSVSVVLITIIMSYFSLVLGELVPKRLAMQKAEWLALHVIGFLSGFAVITKPFVWFLSVSTDLVGRLFGIDPHAQEENVTEEEIRMMVDVGGETGVIEDSQKEMIDNIFEFDDISAEDVMTPRTDAEVIDVEDGLTEALRVGVDSGHSRLPVYEEDIDNIIGVLYVKDLLPYVGQPIPSDVTIRHLLREAHFVPGSKRCGELFSEMTEKRLQLSIVVDEYGGFAGIVTVEDLLESIVGNIQDEFDNEEEEITQTGDNTFEVDGFLAVEELSELLGIELPEGDYETVAGLIMDRLGRIPGEDEQAQVEVDNVTLTILQMDDRRIDRVHVQVTPPAENKEQSAEENDKT